MKNKEKIIGSVVLLGLAMFIFIGVLQSRKPTTLSETEINGKLMESNSENISSNIIDLGDDNEKETSNTNNSKIVVEIKGEVVKPDVYELESGSRINDLINLAGGITENGDIESINRAEILNDGDCIIIKNIQFKNEGNEEEKENLLLDNNSLKSESRKININSADKEELMTLTGIGETKASSIIEYRSKNGKFVSIEQLAEVNGIGIKTVEKLKDKITIK
ncbi:ComEA family DNA-binding protein [Clostridium massiliamazoniense]|uniref:ComEA family DNA-binding protein n=1 Tax=Clostridium massiliamazoniense TaxID=1347366 RepID=UPI0006D7B340|nr:ComEA family DNA-binding protein [Clostridium massiliamazoniense]